MSEIFFAHFICFLRNLYAKNVIKGIRQDINN